MEPITRYIQIKAVQDNKGNLIPLWDDKVTYEYTEDEGHSVEIEGQWPGVFRFVDCIFDLKTKTLSHGVEIDIYPNKDGNRHTVGDVVYEEMDGNKGLREATIVDIIYENYSKNTYKGKEIQRDYPYIVKRIPKLNPNILYTLKQYTPTYILDNGSKVEWEYKLNKKYKDESN